MLSYPVGVEFYPPERLARWRPLVNWLLVIPVNIWQSILQLGLLGASLVSWFAILFTGRMPESAGAFITGVLRYQLRILGYLYGLADRYPGFEVPAGYVDPGDYQTVFFSSRLPQRNRLTVFFRGLLSIPHFIVLYLVGIAAGLVALVAWFAVLITGQWPKGMQDFFAGYLRWSLRVQAYYFLVTDVYPPFGFEA